MSYPSLTPRQHEVLSILERLTIENGYLPSQRAIARAAGVTPASIFQMMETLSRRGYVVLDHGMWRSVRSLRPRGAGIALERASTP